MWYDRDMAAVWMLILPMILWFVEKVFPYPALVEEMTKALVVYRAGGWRQAFGLGLIFGLSEAVLFLVNANILQNMSAIFWRLLLTVPMHGVTSLVFFVFRRQWWLGLTLAVLSHCLFNLKIAS